MNNLNTAMLSMIGVLVFILSFAVLMGYHPVFNSVNFVEDVLKYLFKVLPHRIFALFGLVLGGFFLTCALKSSRLQFGVTDGK